MTQIGNMAQGAMSPSAVPAGLSMALSSVRDRQGLAGSGQADGNGDQPQVAEPHFDRHAAEAAIGRLNEQLLMQQGQCAVQFSVDEDAGRVVIKVTDTETDQLIRQIPPERTLEILRDLAEGRSDAEQVGLLLDETA